MKESERIQQEINNLSDNDNDFKYMSLSKKLQRAKNVSWSPS